MKKIITLLLSILFLFTATLPLQAQDETYHNRLYHLCKFWVQLSPNPFHDQLRIRTNQSIQKGNLRLFDVTGQLLHSMPFTGELDLRTNELPLGLYFVEVKMAGFTTVKKVIKQ